jgi:RNA polymerase sigma-70 factor (ECF subfamily)
MTSNHTEGADTDALVRRAQAGDREAFTALVQAYSGPMYNLAFRMVGNADDAADLAQEIFVKLYRSIGRFRGNARFSTWLYALAANTCRSGLRKLRRRREREVLPLGNSDGEESRPLDTADPAARPDRQAQRRETRRAVETAIAGLPDEFREVITLRDLQGLAYEEIAQAVDCSIGTVKSRLARARMKVRETLVKAGIHP